MEKSSPAVAPEIDPGAPSEEGSWRLKGSFKGDVWLCSGLYQAVWGLLKLALV